jgi:heavy metal sensor kinase
VKLPRLSIGLRLSLWYVLIFALAQCVFGVGMYVVLRHHLRGIVNDGLREEMQDLRIVLQEQKPNMSVEHLSEEVTEAYEKDHAGEYLQIFTAQGEKIYLSEFLAKHPIPAVAESTLRARGEKGQFDDRRMERKRFRFVSFVIDANGRTFLVQLGTPVGEVYETLDAFRQYLLWLAPLVLLIAAVGGNWLSHRALAPVDALTGTARTIHVGNLGRRLDTPNTGDELQRLGETLNEMLARIESTVQRITEFTADASHELRTPVALIRAEAEVALGRERSDEEYRAALQHVLNESERMTRMLEQLLSLVRADSGSETIAMAQVDLAGLARDCVESWQKVAGYNGLRLNAAIPEQAIWVTGDGLALRRVLDILLDNAVKYSDAPGEIQVGIDSAEGRVSLRIRDHGPGLAAEEHAKIFERFYRVDKARSRKMGGAGLGLSIAQGIVQQHHGSITLRSAPGEGTEFCVALPAVEVPERVV